MEINRTSLLMGGLFQIILLLYRQPTALAASSGVDFYKDIIREQVDEDGCPTMFNTGELGDLKFFFCRTPISTFPDVNARDLYEKRTVNKYKNMMLNKDAIDTLAEEPEEHKEAARFMFPRVAPKRTPGAILSWAIPAANRVRVISTNYRPPGMNRPAA
ncbi:uncharacterized protein LOC131440233 [Malaya genurostris]|uniref:uncharacterized protein LOC131440233 n=1 Tax=Malaya genurostris TaxID=325434 RepID=UPI0026F3B656|nr:uncharacterized protein LOC131440233 [Malaya genurostris]